MLGALDVLGAGLSVEPMPAPKKPPVPALFGSGAGVGLALGIACPPNPLPPKKPPKPAPPGPGAGEVSSAVEDPEALIMPELDVFDELTLAELLAGDWGPGEGPAGEPPCVWALRLPGGGGSSASPQLAATSTTASSPTEPLRDWVGRCCMERFKWDLGVGLAYRDIYQ
jgi:hypothetical protein